MEEFDDFKRDRTYAVGHGYYISVPPAGDWAGTRPAPTLVLFPVGATLVVALDSEVRNS
ncbi:MAG: hypothetical protein OXP71_11890 [Candidatus Poribacteria bacterium]|nr:hypothetical protein [Candidatus Poribacteria bacterium]